MKDGDMDLTDLGDDDLDQLRRDVLTEQERRANLAAIPEQIEALAKVYREGGGDEAALTDALTAPDDPFDGGLDLYGVDEETVTL